MDQASDGAPKGRFEAPMNERQAPSGEQLAIGRQHLGSIEDRMKAAVAPGHRQVVQSLDGFVHRRIAGVGGDVRHVLIRMLLMDRGERASRVDEFGVEVARLAHQPIVPITAPDRKRRNFLKQSAPIHEQVAAASGINSVRLSGARAKRDVPAHIERQRFIDAAVKGGWKQSETGFEIASWREWTTGNPQAR